MLNAARFLLAHAAVGLVLVSGCSDDTPATSQVALSVDISPGTQGTAACPAGGAGDQWTIGSFPTTSDSEFTKLSPTKDGDTSGGSAVTVQCQVAGDDNNGYTVNASATLAKSGTFSFHGKVTTSRDDQPGLSATFSDRQFGNFSSNDCTLKFTRDISGVASGRIWATLTCPNGQDPSTNKACKGEAEFRFENCSH